jgi:peptide/nickel transport system substrate-binding protein
VLVTVVLAVLTLLLAACGSSGGSEDSAAAGEADPDATLRLTYAGVASLDPAETPGSTAMLSNTWPVYDRLLQISEDGEYLPMLATEWTFSEDGKTLRLNLRDDVTFTDGTPFTSATVKANIERYQEAPVSAAATSIIDEVETVDEHTVDLVLTSPSRAVLAAIAAAAPGIMISEEALDNPDLGTNPVGSGAWEIESFRSGESVAYTRRGDDGGIWDPETGKVKNVEIAVRTTDAAYSAIRSGQVDVVLSNGDVSELQSGIDQGNLVVRPLKNASTTATLYLNQTIAPFDDVLVRQAVNFAINRTPLVEALVPTTTPRVQPMASVINGFDESLEDTYPYDPEKAKELLAEAGHSGRVDGGTVYVANYDPFPKAAQIVQADLAAVGIDIEIELYDIRQLSSGAYGNGNRSGAMMFLSYPGLEPGVDLRFFLENPLQFPGGVPQRISDQIATIDDSTVSAEERAERTQVVTGWAVENAMFAPLWQGVPGWVMTDKVHGVDEGDAFLAPLGGQDFRHAWMSR